MLPFKLSSSYSPKGDQPKAIKEIHASICNNNKHQVLMGVTGSGKTFTMANIIEKCNKPVLVIAHNKTLAAQLYSELKAFFPENAVEYFVSYYDYYQPEAYVPQTDTYIEKDSSINDDIERLRISATSSLISRSDVIVVASVSCIYGLGSPEDFRNMMISIEIDMEISRDAFLEKLVEIQYNRNDIDLKRGNFRVRGDIVDLFPAYLDYPLRIEFWGDNIEKISKLDELSNEIVSVVDKLDIYPANQYVTPKDKVKLAVSKIRSELDERVSWFESNGMLLEAQRIRMRTEYDIELLQEMGFCSGIENYSRFLSGRGQGERPFCLMDFFDDDYLVFIDESHVTIPQIKAMYNGDRARKEKLVDHGFRLPSALDNRPQTFNEFNSIANKLIYISATPSPYEIDLSSVIAKQVIRPTGLLDPKIEIRPIKGQIEDLISEIKDTIINKDRVLVTTLTKRMSEELSEYLSEIGINVEYLHSDIDAIERVEIIRRLRKGDFDVLIGVNLLREGLDLPEVALVAILDADKEGFLRSTTSLIQTSGRAARHENGKVLLYADNITKSIQETINITKNRRSKQILYNKENNVIPKSIKRDIIGGLQTSRHSKSTSTKDSNLGNYKKDLNVDDLIMDLEDSMLNAAQKLNFEKAALIRDQIDSIKKDKKGVKNLQVNGIKNSFRKKRSRNKFTRDGFPKKKRN